MVDKARAIRLAHGRDRYGSKESREKLFVSCACPPDKAEKAFARNRDSMGANRLDITETGVRVKLIERDRFKNIHYRAQGITRGDLQIEMRLGNLTSAT
jgi:hypothetical protein